MSLKSDNNHQSDSSVDTAMNIDQVDLNRISSTFIPFGSGMEFLDTEGYKMWQLNYDVANLSMQEETPKKRELLIKGCEMYSHYGIKRLNGPNGKYTRKVLRGYIAPSTIPAHDLFKSGVDKLFPSQHIDEKLIDNPLKERDCGTDDKLCHVDFSINDKAKFYDLDGNVLDVNNILDVPIRFIPTGTIKVFMSPHTTKFIISMTEVIITHIGTIHDDLPKHFESLLLSPCTTKAIISMTEAIITHIRTIHDDLPKHFESLKTPAVKQSEQVDDIKHCESGYFIGTEWMPSPIIVECASYVFTGICITAGLLWLSRKN